MSSRKNRSPEEQARREKIRELLQLSNIGSMEDIQGLFKETIAEFMENGLDAELETELGYSKYDYKNKETDNSRNGHSSKTLRTSFGDVEVSVPRDRKGEFFSDGQCEARQNRVRLNCLQLLQNICFHLLLQDSQLFSL